jgi:plasmid stabilization system protein ParE
MICAVTLVDDAEEQLTEINAWWRANRPAAPTLFLDEFEKALDLLAAAPDIGPRFHRARVPGVRRFLLRRSKCYVYYVHDSQRSAVHILALWSTWRGSGPSL